MRSSTSSFKALLVFAGLTIAYALLAPVVFPAGGLPQSQFQENVARLEDLIYAPALPRVVIVGSSMAARLENLPDGFANLAFSGDSALAGLEALERAAIAPPVVLAEVNDSVLRPPSADLLIFANPGLRHNLLRHVPTLRQRFQPYCLLLALLKGTAKPFMGDDTTPIDFEAILALQLKTMGDLPAEKLYATSLADLKSAADRMRSRGSKVLFFDLPREPRILAGARESRFREAASHFFPDHGTWIRPISPAGYQTSDGVHLLPASAARFARELAAQAH